MKSKTSWWFASILLIGCTPVLTSPERPNCTLTVVGTSGDDGALQYRQTQVYDDAFRVVSRVLNVPDQYVQTETWDFDATGCATDRMDEYVYEGGTVYTEFRETECDDNGDPVERTLTREQVGGREFSVAVEVEWDREYGDNGLTSRVEVTSDDPWRGVSEWEDAFTYDKKDRLIQTVGTNAQGTSLTTVEWYDELRADDLRAVEEERDATGFLSNATYTTYDDRGRPVVERTVSGGVETVLTRAFEEDRYVTVSARAEQDGVLVQTTEFVSSGEDVPLERTLSIDDEADGDIDRIQEETWTCP